MMQRREPEAKRHYSKIERKGIPCRPVDPFFGVNTPENLEKGERLAFGAAFPVRRV